jgi:hypothetical protein
MGTGVEIAAYAAIAASAASAGAQVIQANNAAKARAAEAALMRQQAEERKAAIQLDMLDKENEIRRQTGKTIAKIKASRPYQSRDTFGTTSVLAGIREEKRLAEQDINQVKRQGLLSIRNDQFQVARANLSASSARSQVGIAVVKGIASVGASAAKSGVFSSSPTPDVDTFPELNPR